MTQIRPQISTQEDSDLVRALNIFTRNYKILIACVIIALAMAFLFNRFAIPVYRITASLLILEEARTRIGGDAEEYINQDLFGKNQGFQNELYVLKSSPVIEQSVKNLDLTINYFQKEGLRYIDAYKMIPFRVLLLHDHVQPVNVRFVVTLHEGEKFTIKAEAKNVIFTNLYSQENTYFKNDWAFKSTGKFGDLVETPDLAFIIERDSSRNTYKDDNLSYSFIFSTVSSITGSLKKRLNFFIVDRDATVIEIDLKSSSYQKGIDIVNELTNVYSQQNLDRKNHIAEVTIDYIERQLGEISDSLSHTEDNLQYFRSSRQLLNVNHQASSMSEQYMNLQNQMAELVSRKRYYDYLADYLSGNEDLSDIIVPTSMGVQDELLNELVSELITAQTQRSNLIRNRQQRNPLVQRLEIQIENTKKTIYENITANQKTTDIAIDEMNKRINRVRAEISRLPRTQRQLGGIERNYRLNDAIYNYLLEKRAEAKISQASNLPDNIIIEPASVVGIISPNVRINYMFAFALGLMLPYLFLFLKNLISDKIEYQDRISRITDVPLLGKIPHSRKKTTNVVFEYPQSGTAEAYRVLRTNIEYRYKDKPHKVILITSTVEGEGKSFNALNLAMSYAQLDRMTVLVDFDMRKETTFINQKESLTGLSTYLADQIGLEEILLPSPHKKLDYIPSGPIPPNPTELLALGKTRELFDHLMGTYDCIIFDTSPLAQVSDAYLLMDIADIKVIVTRYNFTSRKIFSLVMKDLQDKNIDNACIVMNDNRIFRDQYGYGYGYRIEKRRFFSFIK
jgi:capsular exopolysaccharide synthesis family protein